MALSKSQILKKLNLENESDGEFIYLYRLHNGEFTIEKVLANLSGSHRDVISQNTARSFGKVGYYRDGELTGLYTVDIYEGLLRTSGGTDSIWFVEPNKRKAKKILRQIVKKRVDDAEKRLEKYNKLLKELK